MTIRPQDDGCAVEVRAGRAIGRSATPVHLLKWLGLKRIHMSFEDIRWCSMIAGFFKNKKFIRGEVRGGRPPCLMRNDHTGHQIKVNQGRNMMWKSKMAGDGWGEVRGLGLQARAALKRTHSKRSAFAMQQAKNEVWRTRELTRIKVNQGRNRMWKSKMAGDGWGEVRGLRLQARAALKRTHSKRFAFAMQQAEVRATLSPAMAGHRCPNSRRVGEVFRGRGREREWGADRGRSVNKFLCFRFYLGWGLG